ncbi:DUF4411 family protein [Candidatus Poriferisodalis sp.]|uniref:DUF4411 family protein n=1 Tax=Candidatus Poriferisodalis sp. TaxID=3101277 RepID=UPI003B51A6F9
MLRLGEPDVWVIDASSLIELKRAVGVGDQWDLLMRMRDMASSGGLAAPRQVYREVSEMMHPDAPGAWAASARQVQSLPLDVDADCMRLLLAENPLLADTSKLEEDADPYVVGLARQLGRDGTEVCVVTEDRIDRTSSTSIVTACDRSGIRSVRLREFLDVLGVRYRAES